MPKGLKSPLVTSRHVRKLLPYSGTGKVVPKFPGFRTNPALAKLSFSQEFSAVVLTQSAHLYYRRRLRISSAVVDLDGGSEYAKCPKMEGNSKLSSDFWHRTSGRRGDDCLVDRHKHFAVIRERRDSSWTVVAAGNQCLSPCGLLALGI
jgi:hypothetical protein